MSKNSTDLTGVLIFDGEAIISPAVRLFFGIFHLGKEKTQCNSYVYVAKFDDDEAYDGAGYLRMLVEEAGELGISFDGIDTEEATEVLPAIGRHFGVDLSAISEQVEIEGSSYVNIGDIFKIVSAIPDGHNLVAVMAECGWHAEGWDLWGFGGWGEFISRQYALSMMTQETIEYAKAMHEAIPAGVGATAVVVVNMINNLLGGISDRAFAAEVANGVGAILVERKQPA